MLKSEYEITTGVNSVMTGQTSPSDRRAMGALQTVNAASSMRIESMMQTLLDTMLQSYAEHFVWLIYRYTSDEELISITEDEEIIQKIGSRDGPLDFDIIAAKVLSTCSYDVPHFHGWAHSGDHPGS